MIKYLYLADIVFFYLMAVYVGYLFLFAFCSLWGGEKKYPTASKKHRIVIIIPAYNEDSVIIDSVNSLLNQEYPEDKFDVVIVSDKMTDETNEILSQYPVKLFIINPEKSSKAYALNCAIDMLNGKNYHIVVIMDADNVVEPIFISEINDAFYSGSSVIQTHRTAKNLNNNMAILDAISEEINNSIFRKGHVNLGLSSSLIGSGMAFDYIWFRDNVKKLSTAGEDKELERLILKEGIYIDYLDYVFVYDEKIQKLGAFFNQRRRWIASQLGSLSSSVRDLPGAILSMKMDYIDKIFQWTMLPRVVLLGVIFILSVTTTIIDLGASLKWWALLFSLFLTFVMAVPAFLVNKRNMRAIKMIPVIFLLMFFNFFRLKGINQNFVHTKKEG